MHHAVMKATIAAGAAPEPANVAAVVNATAGRPGPTYLRNRHKALVASRRLSLNVLRLDLLGLSAIGSRYR